MNYNKIYNRIIENAKTRILEGVYLEKHHIVPRCLGGTNLSENIVSLTAREHYICHLLLAKIHNKKKLWAAYAMMAVSSDNHIRIYNNRQFEKMRIARALSSTGKNNGMFGKMSAFKNKKHTAETIEKIRQSKLGKKRKPFTRKPASIETKNKISLSKKGKKSKLKGIVLEKFLCEKCKKEIGGLSNFKRHNNKYCVARV